MPSQQSHTEPNVNQKTAAHWVHQTVKLFPIVGEGPTHEYLAAFTDMLCKYQESVIKEALNPSIGLPSQFEYLPALAKIKEALDGVLEARGRVLESERRFREQMAERRLIEAQNSSKEPSRTGYTGPIEDVKPGDILDGTRLDEYRDFMGKTHGIRQIKMWGLNENWIDNGARPFGRPAPSPAVPKTPEEPNPFEEPQR